MHTARSLWSSMLLFVLITLPTMASSASGAPAQTWQVLSRLGSGSSFSVTLDMPAGATIQIGKPLEFRIVPSRAGYITVVRVDAHGLLELGDPDFSGVGPYLKDTSTQFLSTDNVPEVLLARPPIGETHWFIIYTPKPIDKSALGIDPLSRHALLSAQDSPKVAAELATQVQAQQGSGAAIHDFRLNVSGENGGSGYSVAQIVQYFTQTTRSINRPSLDLYINFGFNSADINSESLQSLQTWGRVLSDPLMANQRFVVGGHTDDVGTETYNDELSLRRAQAVKDYLVAKFGISPDRLMPRGYGKSRPLRLGDSDADRAANRRVDFERQDASP